LKNHASCHVNSEEWLSKERGERLNDWLKKAWKSGIKEIASFAKSLLSDFDAVQNTMLLEWSNGQVEGQINKLKTVKRQLYGKTSFNLLRKMLTFQ